MTFGAVSGKPSAATACFCVGPQNGDPYCPCMMPAYIQRQLGLRALEILRRHASGDRSPKGQDGEAGLVEDESTVGATGDETP